MKARATKSSRVCAAVKTGFVIEEARKILKKIGT